ncbi:aftiphilin-like isoform X2 [Actinia tenebrosa]|uniref:Aftiphilin-like isoform X2 n=1 Tax=Actinia tenebrosa TaxID=6105 RepID=A0A6P8IGY2_ACTTE|nr:aftiphilin-like isoform X2 [Actinia tenebrosa]
MSFYASQFNDKSSRYCSSNLYGSNLSTVYADGPPPLDDTLEEDDGEIVFRDKSPRKESPEPKLVKDEKGTVSGESDFNPWSKNDATKDEAVDDFGDFSGFADFSSAFGGGDSNSQNDSSWFKNGDNDQSSVTKFNHDFENHEAEISASSRKNVKKAEERTSKNDDFGCFSGGDDSDFDDFCSFTSNSQHINTGKSEESSSKDSQTRKDSESKKTTNSDDLIKKVKTIHGSSDKFHYSLEQNAKTSNFDSVDDFDEFGSSEGGSTLNQRSVPPINDSSNSHAQNITSGTHSAMKPTCFSDDDDDFGDFSSSSFDDDSGGTAKTPELIIKSETNFSSQSKDKELQNTHLNGSSIESEHNPTDSKDNNEPVSIPQHNGSETDLKKNEDISMSDRDKDFINTDQSKENITLDDKDDDDEFGDFSASISSVTKTEETKTKEMPSNSIVQDDDDEDFGKFGSPPSLSNLQGDDDDFGEFGAVAAPSKDNDKNDDDDFGDFGAASPPGLPSLHGNSDNEDEFGDFGSGINKPSSQSNDCDGEEFGNFGVLPTSTSAEEKPKTDNDDDDDEFGDFGATFPSKETGVAKLTATEEKTKSNDVDELGDFDAAPVTSKSNLHSSADAAAAAAAADDDDFGAFGSAPATNKPDLHGNDDADDFGDFGSIPTTNNPDLHGNNDDDDFGDFGVASPTSQQNKNDDFGNFPEVKQPNSKDSKSKSTSEPSSLESRVNPPNDEDDEFGQFDAAPSKSSDSDFAGFKSSDKTSKGFADNSSMPQKSILSPFSATNNSQSFSNKDVLQEQPSKLSGNTSVIKPQCNTNLDRLENPIKKCFTIKDVTMQSNVIIQMIEHQVQSERSKAWQQLLTSEKDGSLRFDWVLSEHQVKMLEGLSMLPVKIQTSVSFNPKGQVPTPLFASSMGLLEPVKGVITPFHHVEEINPSQDPFGAPPEVGVQDLGFGKGSKKEHSTLHTESKDNASDTISVSSSLDLDFLAPSSTNGDSTKTESRGLFEDDLLGLGMFNEPSPSPKITNGKNVFKFNNITIPLATNEGNLSEQAKTVVKDFEDLTFMLSKVLMFPLKSKE